MKAKPVYCYYCGIKVDEEAKYCSNCGELLLPDKNHSETVHATRDGIEDAFLMQVHVIDLQENVVHDFYARKGEEALLSTKGAPLISMEPGRYGRDWFLALLGRSAHTAVVTVVRKGNVTLTFQMDDIRTVDPVVIGVLTSLVVHIENPVSFVENIAQARGAYRASDLRDYFKGAVQNAFSYIMRERSVKDLQRDGMSSDRKKTFEVLIENQLKTVLQTNGIYLDQIKSIEYDFKNYRDVIDAHERGFLRSEKDEAEAKGIEKRIAARQKTLDLMGDLSLSDERIEEFLLESEKGKLLRQRELQDIKTALAEKETDHKIKRDFIVRKLQLDQDLDYERRKLLGRAGIDREVAEARYAVIEAEAGLRRIELENEIYALKAKGMAEIEIDAHKDESSLKAMQVLVELKAKKDRDEIENELFREKERLEIRFKEKEREAQMSRRIFLKCLNPDCREKFSVRTEGAASPYSCPKCGGTNIGYA